MARARNTSVLLIFSSCLQCKGHIPDWSGPLGFSAAFLYCDRRENTSSFDLGILSPGPDFCSFFQGSGCPLGAPASADCGTIPSVLSALCLPVLPPTVLAIQAMCTLPERAYCCENLCHINRNMARTLADMSASKCQQLFSYNLWSAIASAQPCDWEYQPEDHLVKMILQPGGWHHAQVPQADLPHP